MIPNLSYDIQRKDQKKKKRKKAYFLLADIIRSFQRYKIQSTVAEYLICVSTFNFFHDLVKIIGAIVQSKANITYLWFIFILYPVLAKL